MTDAPNPIEDPTSAPVPLPETCCGRCEFFFASPIPGQPSYCRRLPPVPFLLNLQWNEDKTQIVGNQQMSMHPTVNPRGWCGEFRRAKAETN